MITALIICILAPLAAFVATWIYFGRYWTDYLIQKDEEPCDCSLGRCRDESP